MNFVPLALPAIKSSFCGDYATPRSHCFSLSALDASVHFGIRSLAQHNFLLLTFPSIAVLHVRIAVPAYKFPLSRGFDSVVQRVPIQFTRTASNAVPANLSLSLTTPAVILGVTRAHVAHRRLDRPTLVSFSDNHGLHRSGRWSVFLFPCLLFAATSVNTRPVIRLNPSSTVLLT